MTPASALSTAGDPLNGRSRMVCTPFMTTTVRRVDSSDLCIQPFVPS